MGELLDKILADTSRRQKANQAIKGQLKNLKTLAIISGENPRYPLPDETKPANIREELSAGGYLYFPTKGFYDAPENSQMIYNMSLDAAKYYASHYGQESFIFVEFKPGNDDEPLITYSYYETNGSRLPNNPKMYAYYGTQTENKFNIVEENNYYTATGRNFKFNIPFEFIGTVNSRIEERKKQIGQSYEDSLKRHLDSVEANMDTGMNAYYRRLKIYGGRKK